MHQEFYTAQNRETAKAIAYGSVTAESVPVKRNITVGADNLLGLFAYLVVHAAPKQMFAQVRRTSPVVLSTTIQ